MRECAKPPPNPLTPRCVELFFIRAVGGGRGVPNLPKTHPLRTTTTTRIRVRLSLNVQMQQAATGMFWAAIEIQILFGNACHHFRGIPRSVQFEAVGQIAFAEAEFGPKFGEIRFLVPVSVANEGGEVVGEGWIRLDAIGEVPLKSFVCHRRRR